VAEPPKRHWTTHVGQAAGHPARDNLAVHAKLDELLRADNTAWTELTQFDEQEPEIIERHHDEEVRKTGT